MILRRLLSAAFTLFAVILVSPSWADQVGSEPAESVPVHATAPGNNSDAKDVKVPNVVGLWRDEAILDLFKAGLRIGDVHEETSTSVSDHHVISESPAAGTEARVGSKIDLVIARAPEVTVPDVVGLTIGEAKVALAKVDLKVGQIEEKPSATVAAGLIISQHPPAGTMVREDRRVRLVVSKGTSQDTVPNVIGATQAAATTAIASAGLTVGTVTMQSSATVVVGLVISESPTAGTPAPAGSAVSLIVSSGVPKVLVPNVVGLTQAAASTAITGAGLVLGSVTTASSATVAAGLVISESPVAGTSVAAKSAVNLVVSSGAALVVVPNVVGAAQAAATATITSAGLTLGTVTTQSSATVAAGLVISESPVAGSSVAAKSAVNLVVSSGAVPVAVPNVVGLTQAAAMTVITGAGLTLGTVTTQSSTTVAAGLVISESPAAGAGVVAGSAVNLTISAGLPVDLTGMTTTTSLASGVPAVAANSITQVVSTADAQPIGTPLIIPTNSVGFSTAIFALDVNQNLILAAYANSNATALSATSTATVLAMFTIGIIPPTGPTFSQVVQDVQSTVGFGPLVAAITASLAAGTPPLQSSAVTQAAALVVNQSLPLIAAQTTAPAAADALSQIRAASVIPPTQVTTMLPFQIFGPSATFPRVQSLYVSSATGDGGVYLINTMPISWNASSTDQNGATLDAGEILGPVNPIYALFITPTAVAIAGNGEEFALLAAQTSATHDANVRQSIADVLGFLIGQLGLKSANLSTCTQSAATNILVSLGTAFETTIINTPTGPVAAAELGGSVVGSSFYNGLRDVMQCALPGSLSQSNVAKAIAGLAGWSNPATGIWKTISITVSAAGPANETALMLYYWNASKPVGICEAGSSIVNCAASFEIPSPGPLQVGASTLLLPQAIDAQGQVTPYGSYTSLFWSSTNEAVATVASGGVVTAVAEGATTISATDLYTGATGSVTVTVTPSLAGVYEITTYGGPNFACTIHEPNIPAADIACAIHNSQWTCYDINHNQLIFPGDDPANVEVNCATPKLEFTYWLLPFASSNVTLGLDGSFSILVEGNGALDTVTHIQEQGSGTWTYASGILNVTFGNNFAVTYNADGSITLTDVYGLQSFTKQ